MSKKRAFGLMFIGISILSSLGNLTLTGNAIGSSYASYLSFLSIFSFVAGVVMVAVTKRETLEEKTENELQSREGYEKLAARLKYMQDDEIVGHDNYKIPIGGSLKKSDEILIKKIILKHMPKPLVKKGVEIAIGGSLAIKKRGVRAQKEYETEKKEKWTWPNRKQKDFEVRQKYKIEGMKSDDFYLSDIDISISGKPIFNYLRSEWPLSIYDSGKLEDKATYEIALEKYLDPKRYSELKSKGKGYMGFAPTWVISLLEELDQYKLGNRKRPLKIKIFENVRVRGRRGIIEDVIYKRTNRGKIIRN